MSRLTDTKRFKLPYRDAATSNKPGYLRRRMKEYADLQKQGEPVQRVVPLRKAVK